MSGTATKNYRSLFINVENVESFLANECPPCDLCHILTSTGTQSLESASAIINSARPLIVFDTVLSFPFDVDKDKFITFSLRDKDTNDELGKHVLAIAQFLNRDSMSAKMKLKNSKDVAIGFLNAKIKISETQVTKATAAKNLRERGADVIHGSSAAADALRLIANNAPDTVSGYDHDNNPCRTVQVTLFQIENCKLAPKKARIRVGAGALDAPVIDSVVNQTYKFLWDKQRFIKLSLLDGKGASIGEGAIDLSNLVTRRQNVVGGSLSFEDKSGSVIGTAYYRLQKFATKYATELVVAEDYGSKGHHTQYVDAQLKAMPSLQNLGSMWV